MYKSDVAFHVDNCCFDTVLKDINCISVSANLHNANITIFKSSVLLTNKLQILIMMCSVLHSSTSINSIRQCKTSIDWLQYFMMMTSTTVYAPLYWKLILCFNSEPILYGTAYIQISKCWHLHILTHIATVCNFIMTFIQIVFIPQHLYTVQTLLIFDSVSYCTLIN